MANRRTPLDTAGQSLMDLLTGVAQAPLDIAGGYLDVLSGGAATQARGSELSQAMEGSVPQEPLDASNLPADVASAFDALLGRVSSPQQAAAAQRDMTNIFMGQDPKPSISPTRQALEDLAARSGKDTLSFVARGDEMSDNRARPMKPGQGQFSRLGADATQNFIDNYGLVAQAVDRQRQEKIDSLFMTTAAEIAQQGGSPAEVSRKLLTLAKITGKPSSAITSILSQVDSEAKTQDDIRALFLEQYSGRKPGESAQSLYTKALQKYTKGE